MKADRVVEVELKFPIGSELSKFSKSRKGNSEHAQIGEHCEWVSVDYENMIWNLSIVDILLYI